jgi:hypothetical protein
VQVPKLLKRVLAAQTVTGVLQETKIHPSWGNILVLLVHLQKLVQVIQLKLQLARYAMLAFIVMEQIRQRLRVLLVIFAL